MEDSMSKQIILSLVLILILISSGLVSFFPIIPRVVQAQQSNTDILTAQCKQKFGTSFYYDASQNACLPPTGSWATYNGNNNNQNQISNTDNQQSQNENNNQNSGSSSPSSSQADVSDLINKGNDMLKQGNYKQGLDYYNQVVTIDPNNLVGLIDRGVAYYYLGLYGTKDPTMKSEDLHNANDAYDKALEINRNNEYPWFLKSLVFSALGDPKDALGAINEAIAINPNDKNLQSNKDEILRIMDNTGNNNQQGQAGNNQNNGCPAGDVLSGGTCCPISSPNQYGGKCYSTPISVLTLHLQAQLQFGDGQAGHYSNFKIATASGGLTPYTFSSPNIYDKLANNFPPMGMSVGTSGGGFAILTGYPPQSGIFQVGVCVQDLAGVRVCGSVPVLINSQSQNQGGSCSSDYPYWYNNQCHVCPSYAPVYREACLGSQCKMACWDY